MDWNAFWTTLVNFAFDLGGKLLGAILVLIIGRFVIKFFMRSFRKSKFVEKSEPTVAHFLINFLNIALNIILVVSIVAILGVPMASVVAAIASAGVAIGLALQGALSNLAGGIMILIFKPFRIGNFIDTGSGSGTVMDIGIFYTVLKSADNKEITIPNGTIMGAAFCAQLNPTATEIADIKCAVSEAVTNCIVHAYRGKVGTIYIGIRLYEERLVRVSVRDRGCGISDVKKAREPLYTTDSENERSGMGFTVMENFMDKLTVSSRLGKGTTVTMYKRISASSLSDL